MSSKQILHFKVYPYCALYQDHNIWWQDCSKESHVFWWGNKKLEAACRIWEYFEYIIVNVNKIIQINTIILMNYSSIRNIYIVSFNGFRYKFSYLPSRKAQQIKLPIHILQTFKESIMNEDELHRYKTAFKIKFILQLHFCALKDNSTFKFLTVLTCYN